MRYIKPIFTTALFIIAISFGLVFLIFGKIPSVLWWIAGSAVSALIAWSEFLLPYYEDRHNQFIIDGKKALTQLRNENGNFEKIIDAQETGKVFGGSHQKAVEVYSFEHSLEEFERLSKYWGFKQLAKKGIRQVKANMGLQLKEMDVENLIKTINQTIKKLDSIKSLSKN
ncbi:MAG TPA: hypothetical protein DCM07_27945 [Planctomycetaceae bacterium]|uniref:hypothetical protein n=1 Tax=Gimesia sp. TaxID=2024833 RepID=UPI000C4EF6A0|nr:hypothetical protein [Gimesia sp.]MAX35507.1 hypothetical protein [Gimesia sp.]HAH48607.1 hypothetical protein [Planctomycetaceae bacterium]HBL46154.1 hypothetical protein [Planctomycetaceae bacterium]|tara:strand:+ start:73 stop:582 length:510 start_codon:yes stop_codon:yes gene_type:complete